jgi:hypothetical protein
VARRITRNRKYLEGLMATVSKMGGWPVGPYPTPGQLMLTDTGTGRYQVSVVLPGTATTDLSQCLTASEMEEFLRGMIAAYDAPRFRLHFGVPSVEPQP